MTTDKRRRHSAPVVDGINKSASRAMLRAVGFTDEDFRKPQIGIASTWSNLTPCNMHIDGLAREAAKGADGAGGKSLIFNTITISELPHYNVVCDDAILCETARARTRLT